MQHIDKITLWDPGCANAEHGDTDNSDWASPPGRFIVALATLFVAAACAANDSTPATQGSTSGSGGEPGTTTATATLSGSTVTSSGSTATPGTSDSGATDGSTVGGSGSTGESIGCPDIAIASARDAVDAYVAAWDELDPEKRLCFLEAAWSTDGVYSDPASRGEGVAGLSDVITEFHRAFPGSTFLMTSGVVEHHGMINFSWAIEGPQPLGGVDFGELDDDGRIRRIVGFFGEPAAGDDAPATIASYLSVWNEADQATWEATLTPAFVPEGSYVDPTGVLVGRDALVEYVGEYRADFPGTTVVQVTSALTSDEWRTLEWTVVGPDGPLYSGRDLFELDEDDNIVRVSSFFGPLPEVGQGGFSKDACMTCADLTQATPPNPDGACVAGSSTSADRWTALQGCVCAQACAAECGDNLCVGQPPSIDCGTCVGLPVNILLACPEEFAACVSDG